MTTFLAWLRRYLASFGAAKKFYKAESFVANAVAVVFGILPDLINLVISQWSMVDALPALTPEHKLYLFGACNLAALLLRTRKQPNMPQAEAIPVATVNVPTTVDVPTTAGGSVTVATQVRMVDAGGQVPPARLPESPAPATTDAAALYAQLVPSAPPPGARFVSFADFVDYGRAQATSLVDDVPWSFTFEGHAVTHENNDLYLIGTGADSGWAVLRFKRGDVLMVGPGSRLQVLDGGAWSGLPA